MTKREYIRKAMSLRPTARQWREKVEQAVKSGCIDVEGAKSFLEVYPLAAAIGERLTNWWLNGSLNPSVRRWTRREANNIKCFI